MQSCYQGNPKYILHFTIFEQLLFGIMFITNKHAWCQTEVVQKSLQIFQNYINTVAIS
jgi:hypothetical protein